MKFLTHFLVLYSLLIFATAQATSYEQEKLIANTDLIEQNYKGAILHYKKAIALEKNNPGDYLKLNQIYGFLGRNEDSLELLQVGVAKNPDNYDLVIRLAYQYELIGNFKESNMYYKRALELQKDSDYAQKGLIRTTKFSTFNSFSEFLVSEVISRNRTGINNVNDKFETKSFVQHFGKYFGNTSNLTAEFHKNTFTKDLTVKHKIDETSFHIGFAKNYNNFYFFASLGRSQYESNDVGAGTNGDESINKGTALFSYTSNSNIMTFSFNKDFYALDQGNAISMEKLNIIDIQNQLSFNPNFSILGQITNGDSKNLDYIIYKLSPHYNISGLAGLSIYLSLERIDDKRSSNYSQHSTGINYMKDWSEKFETIFQTEFSMQDSGKKNLLSTELISKYNFTSSKSLIVKIENANYYGDDKANNYGASLALDMYF